MLYNSIAEYIQRQVGTIVPQEARTVGAAAVAKSLAKVVVLQHDLGTRAAAGFAGELAACRFNSVENDKARHNA